MLKFLKMILKWILAKIFLKLTKKKLKKVKEKVVKAAKKDYQVIQFLVCLNLFNKSKRNRR